MLATIVFIGIAYIALVVGIVGSIYRLSALRHAATPLAPKILAVHALLGEGLPWHLGITVILLAHLVELVFRAPWQRLVSHPTALWFIEGVGLALAIISLLGLIVLLIRCFLSPRVRAVLGAVDLLLLCLLLWEVVTGIGMAVFIRWGASWSTGTTVPYVISLLALHPTDVDVVSLPLVVQAHIVGAWLFLLLLPFSQVLYLLLFPAPVRPSPGGAAAEEPDIARRHLVQGLAGIIGGTALLTAGGLYGLIRYLLGPRLSLEQQVALDEERLLRLEQTTEERDLVLQREREDYLPVALVSELSRTVGRYFTDYQMRPALAFLGKDGFPVLISAKCTHLGCTV
ncbi:MAG TPA: respiratory nitrate reductase subunit gamma, partial [Armatimonadota bacterium]